MTIPFPEVKRVIYKKNPIAELTCEFRFPRILCIKEDDPIDFQEILRKEYPIYKPVYGHQQQFTIAMGDNPVNAPTSRVHSERIKRHVFFSKDEMWGVCLTSTSFSVFSRKYERWEDFLEHMKAPMKAFLDIYEPVFYERIGLQYVDVFRRSTLGFSDDVSWGEMIQPFVAGYFANPAVSSAVKNYNCIAEIDIGKGAIAQINTFLGQAGDMENGKPVGQPEQAFIAISDLFFLKKELSEANESLEYLHSVAYRLIRAIITEKLHLAMEPEDKCQ
jgi:uncharacterized protein (TIGR04255 family)